jgi:hypothetical protein
MRELETEVARLARAAERIEAHLEATVELMALQISGTSKSDSVREDVHDIMDARDAKLSDL